MTVQAAAFSIESNDCDCGDSHCETCNSTKLTKDHIKLLRTARQVSFHNGDTFGAAIRATKKSDDTRDIPATSSHVGDAFYLFFGTEFAREWLTIVNLLRAGDTIEMVWGKDDLTGEYLSRATTKSLPGTIPQTYNGLHGDTLSLRIHRNGMEKYYFLLAASVCPANSARMIQ